MISTKQVLTIVALFQTLFSHAAFAQTQGPTPTADRVNHVRELLRELRVSGDVARERYIRTWDETTKRILIEVDRFIAESVSPRTATVNQVNAGLDSLLGNGKGAGRDSAAFSMNLPGGHFLIIGVEVSRVDGATSLDAISFRAYRETESKYVLVADTDYGLGTDRPVPLSSLNAKMLLRSPIANEFWFIAWSEVPPLTPPTVTTRLFAFDGERFRTIWTTDSFTAQYGKQAVQITPDGGFTLGRMPDPHGDKVVIEQYFVTADGPQKVTDRETDVR